MQLNEDYIDVLYSLENCYIYQLEFLDIKDGRATRRLQH